ncbi:MAG: hypothetical protein ACOYLC_15915 [Armatimonadaceae bacterium]
MISLVTIACVAGARAQGQATPQATSINEPIPVEPTGAAKVRADAEKLKEFVTSDAAKQFLAATAALPEVSERVLYVNRATRTWYTPGEREKLNEEEKAGLTERKLDGEYYYSTRYGSPLAYVRAIDLLARRGGEDGGFAGEFPFTRKRILDYGYGTIGHLRLMASLGARVVGVDTDPSLARLYAGKDDSGMIAGFGGHADGSIRLRTGRFPVDRECVPFALLDSMGPSNLFNPPAASQPVYLPVRYDLFISKNTLKNGYIHPEPTDGKPVDKRMLVDLGTDEESYLKAVHEVLKPGGLFMIYNLSPAPSKPGEAYKPWSDGRCPFTRRQLEAAGFEVLAFDESDNKKAREMGRLLGWADDPDGDGPEKGTDLENDLFSHWMLARKR